MYIDVDILLVTSYCNWNNSTWVLLHFTQKTIEFQCRIFILESLQELWLQVIFAATSPLFFLPTRKKETFPKVKNRTAFSNRRFPLFFLFPLTKETRLDTFLIKVFAEDPESKWLWLCLFANLYIPHSITPLLSTPFCSHLFYRADNTNSVSKFFASRKKDHSLPALTHSILLREK